MQIIDERRDSPRERRKWVRNQQRREQLNGRFDLRDMSPWTYLLAVVVWLTVFLEAMEQLGQ